MHQPAPAQPEKRLPPLVAFALVCGLSAFVYAAVTLAFWLGGCP